MSKLTDEAVKFAEKAHQFQKRKIDNSPYILHPLEVGDIISGITDDEDIIAAGILHDTIEDTNTTYDDILNKFGERVANYVSHETENKRKDLPASATWRIRKEESLEALKTTDDENIKILWLGDKLSNMRSFYKSYLEMGDDAFNFFNEKRKSEHEWYYRSIAEYVSSLSYTDEYKEYLDLLNKIFN